MKRSKFSDEQILAIVKQGEAGRKLTDLCRAYGITDRAVRISRSRPDVNFPDHLTLESRLLRVRSGYAEGEVQREPDCRNSQGC